MMPDLIMGGVATILAGVIFGRAVCVVYTTSPRKHAHPLLFLGFGYSYIILGAGGVFAAVEICTASDLGGWPLWLLLVGSCGLIVFDRRAVGCWTRSTCPMDKKS